MSNLASPVSGGTPLTPTLIAFYATVATVIPVLFIALAVQDTTYQELLRLWQNVRIPRPRTSSRILRFFTDIGTYAVREGLYIVVVFILLAGGYGEFSAIYALYQDHDAGRSLVLRLVALLIVAVVARPALAFIRALFRLGQDNEKAGPSAASAGPLNAEPDEMDAESDQESHGQQSTGLGA